MNNKYFYLFKSKRYFISIIILVLLLVYFQSFFHGLIFLDDDALIYTKFNGMGLGEKISFSFTSNYLDVHYYRPITLLSLIIDSLPGGQSYFTYHFTNFILHLITCITIFMILKMVGASNFISFLTTLFFALSPIQINAIGWIAGRGDLLAAFFSAIALLIYLNFLRHDKTYLLIFVSVLLFLAILSKEVALLVPFLFVGLYFIEKKNFELNRNSIGILVMFVAILGAYYLLRGIFLLGVHLDKFSFTTYYKNILVLAETISKFFIPIGIKALAGIEAFTSISGTILLVLLFILPLILNSINKTRYYFGFLWFVLLLLPGMVFRTMGQDGFYYWDCRSYLPAIGFLFMITELLNAIYLKRYHYSYFGLTILYLLALGTITFIKIKLYESPVTYWNSVKADYPSSFLPYVGLFNYYEQQKKPEKAENQLSQAIDTRPEELSIRNNLLNFYIKHKYPEKALILLKKTLIDKKIYSDILIEKYIVLLYEYNRSEEVDELYKSYSNDKNVINKIDRVKANIIKNHF